MSQLKNLTFKVLQASQKMKENITLNFSTTLKTYDQQTFRMW